MVLQFYSNDLWLKNVFKIYWNWSKWNQCGRSSYLLSWLEFPICLIVLYFSVVENDQFQSDLFLYRGYLFFRIARQDTELLEATTKDTTQEPNGKLWEGRCYQLFMYLYTFWSTLWIYLIMAVNHGTFCSIRINSC